MRMVPVLVGVLAAFLLVAGPPDRSKAEEAVFPLEEVSVFDSDALGDSVGDLVYGARATTQDEPFAEVKAYPKLRSKKPIYGLIRLAPEPYKEESGTPLYFVADESGEAAAEEKPKEEKPKETDEPSLLEKLSSAIFGENADSPKQPPAPKFDNTYDRLYVDLDGDLDLTNDRVVEPMEDPPAAAVQRYSSIRQCVVFDEIAVPVDLGPELGKRPIRLVPRVVVQEYQEKQYRGASFISAVARLGSIKLGDHPCKAVLAQRYLITGRYDSPATALLLKTPEGKKWPDSWWGSDQLNAMRLVDGKYYTTSASPAGDKLTVDPYEGDFGILKIGPGKRDLDKTTIQGSLQSKEVALAVGKLRQGKSTGWPEAASECRLPVGDYIPTYVTIEFGHLRLNISQNYHADGKPQKIDADAWNYGIKIRKDKPFVWDFSTPPDVMFASPAKDQTYKPGDEISVKAVLIDPKLTVMIRGLTDVDRKENKTIELGEGRTTTIEQQASLDPVVTITDSSGKQVAEGPMPFG